VSINRKETQAGRQKEIFVKIKLVIIQTFLSFAVKNVESQKNINNQSFG